MTATPTETCDYCDGIPLYYTAKLGTLDVSEAACAKHLTSAVNKLLGVGEDGVQIFPAQPQARNGGAAEIRHGGLRLVESGRA
jgi:hypothetical protein